MPDLPSLPEPGLLDALRGTRRSFHREPELSWTEYLTTARLCAELEALGFTVEWGRSLYGDRTPSNPPDPETSRAAYARAEKRLDDDDRYLPSMQGNRTGLVATLEGENAGPVWGFRFDIDALPIEESRDAQHLPVAEEFRSQHPGIMHACGHDGHLTIGLGLARRLAEKRAHWDGRVHLFFQPAEEVAGGGAVFADLPQLAEVNRFLTLHLGIVNRYCIVCDTTWIAARIYDVIYHGKASHAGNAPQEGRNALLAACQAVQALYALPRHSAGMSRVNVGRFVAENAQNVIADRAAFRYEVRGADDAICNHMADAAKRVLDGAAAMQGVTLDHERFAEFSSQRNSPEMARRVAETAGALGIPDELVQERFQASASEDAGLLIRKVIDQGGEATHLIIGSPTAGGHHSSRFDFDEQMLAWAVLLLEHMVTGGR